MAKAFQTEDDYMIFTQSQDNFRSINGQDLLKVMAELKEKYPEEVNAAYAQWIEACKAHGRMWKTIRRLLVAQDLI